VSVLSLKVVELGAQQFATPFEPLATHLSNQPAKFGDDLVHTAELVSQNHPQAFVFGTPFHTLVALVSA
jgi:hypothetical protein